MNCFIQATSRLRDRIGGVVGRGGVDGRHHAVRRGGGDASAGLCGGFERAHQRADPLPDLLRDERHQRMQRAQQRLERGDQRAARAALLFLGRLVALQHGLRELEVPVAEFVPGEFVERGRREVEAVFAQGLVDARERRGEARHDPAVDDRQLGFADEVAALDRHHDEPRTVPELVAEVAIAADPAEIEVDVARRAGERSEREPQRVRSVGGDAHRGTACASPSRSCP